eukprot:scaffold2716_cov179-Amphora_coffeaeformis.AAC.7
MKDPRPGSPLSVSFSFLECREGVASDDDDDHEREAAASKDAVSRTSQTFLTGLVRGFRRHNSSSLNSNAFWIYARKKIVRGQSDHSSLSRTNHTLCDTVDVAPPAANVALVRHKFMSHPGDGS